MGRPRWDGGSGDDDGIDHNSISFNADVERQRRMGAQSTNRAAPQLDLGNANESRGMQLGALGAMRNQATGEAPSAAEIQSQRANQNAAHVAGSASLSAKGGQSGLAAFNQAAPAASNAALQTNAQNAGTRAAEVSRGQEGLAKGANLMEGQDISSATQNANYVGQQRALDENRQQGFEQRAWNARREQQDMSRADEQARLQAIKERQQKEKDDEEDTKGWINTGIGAAKTVLSFFSDERAKQSMRPMGSLGKFKR